MGNKNCLNCINNENKISDVPVEDKINQNETQIVKKKNDHQLKVISEEEKFDLSNENLLKDQNHTVLDQTKTVNFNFNNDNHIMNSTFNEISKTENHTENTIESQIVNNKKSNSNVNKHSDKKLNSNKFVLKKSDVNFTFSKETKSFVNNIIQNNANNCQVNKNLNPFLNFISYKSIANSPDEVILQNEFYFNSKMINNTINRMKTVEVSRNKKYILLTRTHIKLYKNKNIYISYGSIEEEYKLNDIIKCEFINNPFRKMKLYTINFLHGKSNLEFSISSENQSDIETWFKLIKFLMNSSFL